MKISTFSKQTLKNSSKTINRKDKTIDQQAHQTSHKQFFAQDFVHAAR